MNDARPEPGVRPASEATAQPYVRIVGVTRKFGEVAAVDDVTLEIYRGEVFCLLGGSGCGKTTLLRILAGLEPATTGRVLIDGVDVTGAPPYRRPVNMMFQSYALFPHMTVRNNVAFGLRQDGLPSAQIRRRVASMLDLVKLGPFARRKPHQLSGGQRQRVALARALIKQPKLLLLDEPLGPLDRQLREEMQFELINIQQALGVTFVVVTRDQEEAMTLSSRIGVMHAGRIVQTGPPTEIYEYPRSRFVARFIGSVNLFEGRVVKRAADHVMIASEEAGCTLAVEHAVPVAAGAPGGARGAPGKAGDGARAARRRAQPCPGRNRRGRVPGRAVDLQAAYRDRAHVAPHSTQPGPRDGGAPGATRAGVRIVASGERRPARLMRLTSGRVPSGRTLVIAAPYLWLLLFFLVPLAIVLKIALSEALIAQPPYAPLFARSADGALTGTTASGKPPPTSAAAPTRCFSPSRCRSRCPAWWPVRCWCSSRRWASS